MPNGYGKFMIGGACKLAHRVAFFLFNGEWPRDCACHHCDNRKCCNPLHLFNGTRAENAADMTAKGRGLTGLRRWNCKLNEAQVADIRALAGTLRQREIAERFGIKQSHVSRIIHSRRRIALR
jgi:predicted XRE-type DNA-binding protein